MNKENCVLKLVDEIILCLIISRSFLLRMRNVSDKSCRENQKTRFVCSDPFFSQNRAVYEIMWKNIIERGRPHMTIWRMHIACWIPKATNTHINCVILIAFPLQQWLNESASMLRYTYIACLVTLYRMGHEKVARLPFCTCPC